MRGVGRDGNALSYMHIICLTRKLRRNIAGEAVYEHIYGNDGTWYGRNKSPTTNVPGSSERTRSDNTDVLPTHFDDNWHTEFVCKYLDSRPEIMNGLKE